MTHDRSDLLAAITADADALTKPWQHAEPIPDRDRHGNRRMRRVWITAQASLLDQLATAVIPGEVYVEGSADDPGGAGNPRSMPPARLEAVDRLLAIEAAAADWCWQQRLPLRDRTADNIRALVGATGVLDDQALALLRTDISRWHSWAATTAGWQSPPWRPPAPCPICGKRDALRVRLATRTAYCTACHGTWTPDTIGLLAGHVIAHRAAADAARDLARLHARVDRLVADSPTITT